MGRLIQTAFGCAVLAALLACSGKAESDDATFSPDPTRVHRVAWIGVCADGAPLVVEPLAPAHHPELARVNEENMLRELFGLAEDAVILRVHSCGSTTGSPRGSVRTPAGELLEPLGNPPEEMSSKDRLIWQAVARGGEGAWTEGRLGERRSYLIAGAAAERTLYEALDWIQPGREAKLERQSWTERERRAFLDASFAAPAEDDEQEDVTDE